MLWLKRVAPHTNVKTNLLGVHVDAEAKIRDLGAVAQHAGVLLLQQHLWRAEEPLQAATGGAAPSSPPPACTLTTTNPQGLRLRGSGLHG
jgi:hypothetical protein